jgi:transposase
MWRFEATTLIWEDSMLGTVEIKAQFSPWDYEVFAGLDVDKKHIDVAYLTRDRFVKSMKIPYDATHLATYTRRQFPDRRVVFVYEAGPTGFGLYDQLTAEGFQCVVVAPSMVPSAPGQRVKTNRLDAVKLGTALRGGAVKSIHVPTRKYRELRHLVQLRDTLARQASTALVRIKALLLLEGIAFPDAKGTWSRRAYAELPTLVCSPAVRFKLDRLLSAATFASEQAKQTIREIKRFCASDPEMTKSLELLMTCPGIGRITATHLLARIGDWRNVASGRKLSGFLGLVPKEDSTGDSVNRGSITKGGDRRLRAKLILAAWSVIRKDPELGAFYARIYQRNPKPSAAPKAITAVAHKLCKRIACILREQRPYVVRATAQPTEKEETAMLLGKTRARPETSAA